MSQIKIAEPNDLRYTYPTVQREKYQKLMDEVPVCEEPAELIMIEHGIILPSYPDKELYWGRGGVFTTNGQLIEESIVPGAFGGMYDYNSSDIDHSNETVIFSGLLPLHWGHFIIDFLSRLWFVLQDAPKYRIAYIAWPYGGSICGIFQKCFEHLGIAFDRLLKIERPTQFRKILVAKCSMSFAWSFDSNRFTSITSTIMAKALKDAETMNLRKIEKIYFTRTQFSKKDIGEWEIERGFKMNGYTILSPEKLSLAEQAFYIHHADVIASLAGTICHNYIFASHHTKTIILNRFHSPFWPQYRINYIFNLQVEWVDVYHQFRNYPEHDDSTKVWVEFSKCLKQYFADNSMAVPQMTFWPIVRNRILYWHHWTLMPKLRNIKWKVKKYTLFVLRLTK